MRVKVVSIRNSTWIRLPRAIIEQAGLTAEIDLEVKEHCLVIRPLRPIRANWEESFRKMHENGDDKLLDEADAHALSERDETEWTW